VRVAWWQERQDQVIDGFFVEPQNQGQAGTTWEPSHEWRLAEATLSLQGLRRFTTKPSGYLVEPQNQDRRLGGQRWDPSALRSFEAEDTRRDRKACVQAKQGAVAENPSNGATTRILKVPFGGC
jgi:hypothetical protein